MHRRCVAPPCRCCCDSALGELYEAGKLNTDPFTAAGACDSFANYVQGYVEQGLRAHPTVTVTHY